MNNLGLPVSTYKASILHGHLNVEVTLMDPKNYNKRGGYVYVMTDGAFYKIGASRNVERRLEQLNVASPRELVVIDKIKTDDMFGLERALHTAFNGWRRNGEFFDLADFYMFPWLRGISTHKSTIRLVVNGETVVDRTKAEGW